MSYLAFFLLASAGITIIVTKSYLFSRVRVSLGWRMLTCPLCFGVYAGLLVWTMLNKDRLMQISLIDGTIDAFLHAMAASFASFFSWKLISEE